MSGPDPATPAATAAPAADGVRLRPATAEDGPAVWRVVRDAGVLDLNSVYCYLVLCRDFGATCRVAEHAGRVVAFVTAYRPPERPDTLFVWQIGVLPAHRGAGLATRLLRDLLDGPGCRGVRFLETTITPSNAASRALFEGLARTLGGAFTRAGGFSAGLFPESGHEPEERYRIGPFARGASDRPDPTPENP
jgi:L-2,4-diaminobutyric acid acetyltransferase